MSTSNSAALNRTTIRFRVLSVFVVSVNGIMGRTRTGLDHYERPKQNQPADDRPESSCPHCHLTDRPETP